MSESIRKLNGANMDIDLASREEASHGIRIGAPGTKQREQRYTGV